MQAWGEGGGEQEAWEVAQAEIPERAVGRKRATAWQQKSHLLIFGIQDGSRLSGVRTVAWALLKRR